MPRAKMTDRQKYLKLKNEVLHLKNLLAREQRRNKAAWVFTDKLLAFVSGFATHGGAFKAASELLTQSVAAFRKELTQ